MKQRILILFVPLVVLWLFAAQNAFLFGLPFIHAGSNNSDVSRYMGDAEYSGDISTGSNVIYFVRFYPIILATVNVNQNVEGTYVGDNRGHNVVIHDVNWVKWTWTPCFDRGYAVNRSLPRPDSEAYWHLGKPAFPTLSVFVPLVFFVLISLFLSLKKFRKFGNSVNFV